MSRIDQALRIAEGAAGAATAEPPIAGARPAPFGQYQPEHSRGEAEKPIAESGDSNTAPSPILRRAVLRGVKSAEDDRREARLVSGNPGTVSVEQYRRLAAVLIEAQARDQIKTMMITSALPHEGKTLTIVNLALTLSESYGRHVLVIDADLRWPSLHTVLQIPNERGLSEAIERRGDTLPLTRISEKLTVMTAGSPGDTPLAGLSSPRMAAIIEECAAQFEWVLIDTPPVGVLSDAQVLARWVGGVLLVVAAGSTPAAAVERAVTELGGPDMISGIVLNRVEEDRIPDAGYYSQYQQPRG